MSTRSVILASVCSVFLAASAAVAGTAFAANPENSKLVSDAYKALQAGDTVAAATAYSQAIEVRGLEPKCWPMHCLPRPCLQRLNEHARAVDDYTAAMRIDAMSAQLRALALYNRGLSYQKLDQGFARHRRLHQCSLSRCKVRARLLQPRHGAAGRRTVSLRAGRFRQGIASSIPSPPASISPKR